MSEVAVLVIDMQNTYRHKDADVLAPNVAHILRVFKVRHSAFHSGSLDGLLGRPATRRLIRTGQVTEQCILYSALDAYVRHFEVVVPPDTVAHIDAELGDAALTMMEKNMHAEIVPAEKCLG